MSDATVAVVTAWIVVGTNGLAGAYAALKWWQVRPTGAVWPLLRAGQAVAVAQAVVAGVLALAGYDPADGLYWLYALVPVAIGLIAEQLRVTAAEQILEQRGLPNAQAMAALPEAEQRSIVLSVVRREIGIVTLAALVTTFLALRAALIV